jgi:hypothetical protein
MQTNIQTQAARNSDPITSHMAADDVTVTGKRQSHIRILSEVVANNPGMTSAEIAFMISDKHPDINRHEVARRLADAKGCTLRQGVSRKCRQSRRMCITWWPTETCLRTYCPDEVDAGLDSVGTH